MSGLVTTGTVNIEGTGGIIEGNLGTANVNVNFDPIYGNFNATTSILTSQAADHDDIFAGNGGAISAWIYPKTIGENSGGRIADKGVWICQLNGQSGTNCRIEFTHTYDGDDGTWITTEYCVPLNAWTHVAVVFDSDDTNDCVIYINGVAKAVTESGSGPSGTNNDDSSSHLTIGNRAATDRTFDGYIMDFKIYKNVTVTATNVAKMASRINVDKDASDMPTSGIQGWFKLNASTTADSSGESNNITTAANMGSVVYDAFSVDVYDNSTTTDGTFTVTQGKVEGLALTSLDSEADSDTLVKFSEFNISTKYTLACWVNHESVSGAQTYFGGNSANEYFDLQNSGDTLLFRPKSTIAAVQIDVSDAIGAAIATGRWYHLAVSRNDTAVEFYIDGIKAGATQTLAANEAHAMDAIFAEHDGDDAYNFDGKGRDFRIYDFPLTADQMASLYSNTFVTTPLHWWKLDEGHATAALNNAAGAFADSGTGTAANGQGVNFVDASGVNGTLDLDGQLVVAANGTLSMPRGDLQMSIISSGLTSFEINCTDVTTQFIHNNGQFVCDASNTFEIDANGAAFYKVKGNTSGGNLRLIDNTIIEKELVSGTGASVLIGSGKTYTFGTATESADINHVLRASLGASAPIVTGASTLYPVNINVYDDMARDMDLKLANVNVTTAVNFNRDKTVTLTGDCEFDAVTISDGDTLDVNGQRVEFGGDVTYASGSTLDADGLMVFHGGFTKYGTLNNAATSDIMTVGAPTGTPTFSYITGYRTFFTNGGVQLGTGGFGSVSKAIVASGTLTTGTRNTSTSDFTIARGGTFDANDNTHTVSGNFRNGGGLYGDNCLELNGSDEYGYNSGTTCYCKV